MLVHAIVSRCPWLLDAYLEESSSYEPEETGDSEGGRWRGDKGSVAGLAWATAAGSAGSRATAAVGWRGAGRRGAGSTESEQWVPDHKKGHGNRTYFAELAAEIPLPVAVPVPVAVPEPEPEPLSMTAVLRQLYSK